MGSTYWYYITSEICLHVYKGVYMKSTMIHTHMHIYTHTHMHKHIYTDRRVHVYTRTHTPGAESKLG